MQLFCPQPSVWPVSGTPAWASEHQSTLSAGYLHARTNVPGSDNLNGINVKYRYEFTDTLGLVTSFSYANAKDEQKRITAIPAGMKIPCVTAVQRDGGAVCARE